MSRRRFGLAASAILFVLCSCSERSSIRPEQQENASNGGMSGGMNWNPSGGGPSTYDDSGVPCLAEPEDEFFVPCLDASIEPDAASPGPDATTPPETPREDGGVILVDGSTPIEPLPNACVVEPTSCEQAVIITQPSDVECTIEGEVITVRAKVCETCGVAGRLLQFWVGTKICGSCSNQASRGAAGEPWFAANACMDMALDLDLSTWVSLDPCVDVYPRFDNAGDDFVTEASYEVLSCRCDRQAQTCITCADGACDTP